MQGRGLGVRFLSRALFTDLYELTMAQAFWQSGQGAPATFSLFFRKYPPGRAYFVFAGLDDMLAYLEGLRFTTDDLAYLGSLRLFHPDFLDFLGGLRFTGSVRAVPDGTIVFADEPAVEVTAPVIEAQIAETYLLNQASVHTVLATKASRVVHAARGRGLVDFAPRRTHGEDAAHALARASYLVGFTGTSNCLAGQRYGIPVYGTMAHSFVMSFAQEIDSFRAYAHSFPDSTTLLVDTYDSIEGTKLAIRVAREMQREGRRLQAVRLDSGDMAALAKEARRLLDEAGFRDVQIFASGGLDEFEIEAMLSAGAPINAFGVGTKLGVSADAPWVDWVYKLVAYDGHPVLKLSTGKVTWAGPKQVYRLRDSQGRYARDILATATEPPPAPNAEPLLRPVMERGKRLAPNPTLDELRARFAKEWAALPDAYKALTGAPRYPVDVTPALRALEEQLTSEHRRA